ncbi:hypothetical protein MMC14_007120 [Varicellaria rhodocarpa]|nr:hypothetical protein [Varicellaria rhodocarpa]
MDSNSISEEEIPPDKSISTLSESEIESSSYSNELEALRKDPYSLLSADESETMSPHQRGLKMMQDVYHADRFVTLNCFDIQDINTILMRHPDVAPRSWEHSIDLLERTRCLNFTSKKSVHDPRKADKDKEKGIRVSGGRSVRRLASGAGTRGRIMRVDKVLGVLCDKSREGWDVLYDTHFPWKETELESQAVRDGIYNESVTHNQGKWRRS